jgi:HK97 family phage major capsid protein
MARQAFEAWIPEEWSGAVITKMAEESAVERLARVEPMSTDTKHVPRSGGVSFAGAISKGVAYTEDGSTNDEVLLTARKLGVVIRIADEDIKDTAQVASIIQTKQLDWARAHAVGFDNACLGATAAENGTTVPFTSVYKALTTANAATGYTANANRVQTAGTGANVTYSQLSNVFGKVENGNFWSDGSAVVIAHPAFRAQLRGLLDSAGAPIFNEYQNAGSGPLTTLFGVPVAWSRGAKTNATASDSPTGNPLLVVGSREMLIKGDRSGPEYMLAGADSGAAFLTDETLMKMRIRRGFAVGNENALAVLELLP